MLVAFVVKALRGVWIRGVQLALSSRRDAEKIPSRSLKERKLVLIVHANSVDSWQSALDAHADIIAHGLWVWPGDFGNSAPPPAASNVIAAASRLKTRVQPTMQTVAGERAMIDPALLNDPRLAMALPPGVIAYLRAATGRKGPQRAS